jgi:hypothetical protein
MTANKAQPPAMKKHGEASASDSKARERAEQMREEEDRLPVNPYLVNQETKR